jgi:hypothetical protein
LWILYIKVIIDNDDDDDDDDAHLEWGHTT